MNNSLVSIAMTTYNGEKYLKEQLDSIFNQSYKNLEVIVCDDCSNDKTVEILEEYSKNFGLKYFSNENNLGFKKNFEKAISLCTGDFIALADQDDIWEKHKIEILVKNIGVCSLIHSASSLIDENSNFISPLWIKQDNFKYSFEKMIFGNTITGCTTLFKRELLKDFSPIPSGEKYHDWWLALLATKNNGITYVNEPLVKYRQHSSQDTGARVENIVLKIQRIIKDFFIKEHSNRYFKSTMQERRLESFLYEKYNSFTKNEIEIITDALTYHKNYKNSFFHYKSFLISIKYNQYIYFKNNYFIKNFLRDIIG
ncbi:glycosyltransferase family 2 protein [Candidatus Woesearchaeota archaeon]|nr:MAG: glycosyltransferase family 2 protein [Candidatus Woesearchaeota archaeon]